MGLSGYISFTLVMLFCANQVLLQPENVQWDFGDIEVEPVNHYSSSERNLLRELFSSKVIHKKSVTAARFKDQGEESPLKTNISKKGLGIFKHGRPSLYFKSGFISSNSESFNGLGRSNFGLTRYGFDRPRPLRWG